MNPIVLKPIALYLDPAATSILFTLGVGFVALIVLLIKFATSSKAKKNVNKQKKKRKKKTAYIRIGKHITIRVK